MICARDRVVQARDREGRLHAARPRATGGRLGCQPPPRHASHPPMSLFDHRAAVLVPALAAAGGVDAQRAPATQTSIGISCLPGAPAAESLWREGDRGERLQLEP